MVESEIMYLPSNVSGRNRFLPVHVRCKYWQMCIVYLI